MLCIKLSRIGKKKNPFYRIIVLEKSKDPFGDYLELLGNYNPKTKEINLKKDRIQYWLSCGAQTTVTVHNLFIKEGIIKERKRKAVKLTKKRLEKIKSKEEKAKVEERPETLENEVKKEKDVKQKEEIKSEKHLKEHTEEQAINQKPEA